MRRELDFLNLVIVGTLIGCGAASNSPESGGKEIPPSGVTVSLNGPGERQDPKTAVEPSIAEPADQLTGVDLLLQNIYDLKQHSLPEDPVRAAEVDRTRQLKIVEIATEAIRECGTDAAREASQLQAVTELLEARLQLAVSGTDADVAQLYEDAKAVYAADATAPAAAEGIYALARFAHEMARQSGGRDLRWFENFSRWSREFASRFPQKSGRAIALLLGAGRSCELHSFGLKPRDSQRLKTEATNCFTAIVEQFPDSAAAGEAAATLRRFKLPGSKLEQFAGPTIDGGYFDAKDAAGRVTVIYFWDSITAEFTDDLVPLLVQANKVAKGKIRFIGVGLDSDLNQLQGYRKKHALPGDQISFADPKLRGWNSPLVRFWGVTRCPSVWLIDASGVVQDVDVSPDRLVSSLRSVVSE